MPPHPNTPAHVTRFRAHMAAAEILSNSGDDWAVVCYFYAAFHAARIALLNEPRLDSDASARAVDSRFGVGTRHVDFHNGHPSRGPGMNDIVRVLYPSIGATYVLLHTRSVEVRYQFGMTAGTIADARALLDNVLSELDTRGLTSL